MLIWEGHIRKWSSVSTGIVTCIRQHTHMAI